MVLRIIWVSSSLSTHSSRGSLNGFSQALRNQNPSYTQGSTPNVKPHPSHTQCQTTPKVQPNKMPSYTQCPTPNAKPHPITNTQCRTTPKVQHPMSSYTQCPTPYVLAANQVWELTSKYRNAPFWYFFATGCPGSAVHLWFFIWRHMTKL